MAINFLGLRARFRASARVLSGSRHFPMPYIGYGLALHTKEPTLTGRVGTRANRPYRTPERDINQLKSIKRAYKHAAEPVLRTGSKHGGGWRARWRARRPALHRVEDGELEANKPPVEGWKITCARKEWLRGWWWVGRMGGQAGSAPC